MLSQYDLTTTNGQPTTDSAPAVAPVTQNYPPLPKIEQTQSQSDAPPPLSDLQHAAIKLLLTGYTLTSIAIELGLARKTLYNWRHHNSPFRSELSRCREDLYGQASDRYRSLLNSAMDTLERQVKDKFNPTSHRAARTLLSLSKLPQHLFPTPHLTNYE